ncbi:MAG: hypothetical protein QOH60_4967 [Mycobacterium sp.]|jgi:hypothetical protein|nr:hypothetical protein [Mycobacterium sp.]
MTLLNTYAVGMRSGGTGRALPCAGWAQFAIDAAHASATAAAVAQRKHRAATASVVRGIV